MSSEQRRAIAVVAALVLLAISVVAWWGATPDPQAAAFSEPDLGPRPAASQRGRAVLARSGDEPARRPRAAPSPVPSPSERIRLGGGQSASYTLDVMVDAGLSVEGVAERCGCPPRTPSFPPPAVPS